MRRIVLASVLLALALAAPAQADGFQAHVRMAKVGNERIAWYERGSGPPW